MATKKTPAKKPSAGSRIKEQGKSLVWTTFTESEKQKLRTAAASVGKPMSQFLKECGLAEAERILEKIRTDGLT